jgi:hypothetical protein
VVHLIDPVEIHLEQAKARSAASGTCDFADRPDAERGGLQPLVDLDVSPVRAGQFQAESFAVRIATCGDQC